MRGLMTPRILPPILNQWSYQRRIPQFTQSSSGSEGWGLKILQSKSGRQSHDHAQVLHLRREVSELLECLNDNQQGITEHFYWFCLCASLIWTPGEGIPGVQSNCIHHSAHHTLCILETRKMELSQNLHCPAAVPTIKSYVPPKVPAFAIVSPDTWTSDACTTLSTCKPRLANRTAEPI